MEKISLRERIARLLLRSTWNDRFKWEEEDENSKAVYLRNADALIAAGYAVEPVAS